MYLIQVSIYYTAFKTCYEMFVKSANCQMVLGTSGMSRAFTNEGLRHYFCQHIITPPSHPIFYNLDVTFVILTTFHRLGVTKV